MRQQQQALEQRATIAARHRGLTLIELLVVMAIAAVLLAIGVPSFQSTIRANRLSAATDTFVASLNLARGEAVRLGCPINVASTSATADWGTAGWTVAPSAACPAAGPLQVGAALGAPMSMYASVPLVAFDPTGRAGASAVFVVCLDGPTSALANASRAILVSASGRIRVANNNATGVPVNDNGAAVAACNGP